MKQPSDYGKEQKFDRDKKGKVDYARNDKRSRRKKLTISLVLLAGISGGLAMGWVTLQRKLVPLIETEVTTYLDRPIEVGKLKRISPFGVRFGESKLPPTATNPDYLSAEAIQVNFSPWQFLLKRDLILHISVIRPDVYIEQDERGVWTPTDFGTGEESTDKWLTIDAVSYTHLRAHETF